MNKKGFTLIELIAVVVIMAIIALIATPNIVNMMDRGKKEDYIAYAKEIICIKKKVFQRVINLLKILNMMEILHIRYI